MMQRFYWWISVRRRRGLLYELAWALFRRLNRGRTFRCFKPEWIARCFSTYVETWNL
jgi:hypothetical protein